MTTGSSVYVCITINQPDAESNLNPITLPDYYTACSGKHSTEYCHMSTYPEKSYEAMLLYSFLLLSVVIVRITCILEY